MSLENTAIDAKNNLKKAIKSGKTECTTVAAIINQIIDRALWEYLTIPGDTASDKLHNLITLPYDRGGLNTEIHDVDALLSLSPSTQRKFRVIVHKAKQGQRNDLRPQVKEETLEVDLGSGKKAPTKSKSTKSKKPKSTSSSQLARDRAADRAAKALPEIDMLLEEGLVAKDVAAKLGKVVKNPENLTDRDKEIVEERNKAKNKLAEITAKPFPEDPQAREKLKKEVKSIINEAVGIKSPIKVSLNLDPQIAAKTIVKAVNDLDYLQQLKVAIDLEIEDMQNRITPINVDIPTAA